ncbi:MAG: hypothetical protein CVU78_02535 [Elusimicrobia bacterium HGW-Elusimicrobia-2]|nr:MAG: hypothetical protein CVU78_02535 [Elusimicrobia bacterium HGW-Elusimicrobia-2]
MNCKDRQRLLKIYKKISRIVKLKSGLQGLRNKLERYAGVRLCKSQGEGRYEICFSDTMESRPDDGRLVINVNPAKAEDALKIKIVDNLLKAKKIKFKFRIGAGYDEVKIKAIMEYIEQIHPEAVTLFPVCKGRGIDVGCGYRKTHPDAIGVDWIAKGESGLAGNVTGKASAADVRTSGDDLNMFEDDSLDYVVSRHNLEHYRDPEKTLREWIRVLKPGGLMGIIVPDSRNPATAEETHYYNFTEDNFRGLLESSGCLMVEEYGVCLATWSFYCVARKRDEQNVAC